MNVKKFYLLIGIVLIVGFLPQGSVSADMGPKPTMHFNFEQDIPEPELTIVSWSMLNCQNSECSTLEEIIPMEFTCSENSCRAGLHYGIQHDYFQMEITFSDGITRKSNVFTRRYYDAYYKVTVTSDSLFVKEIRGSNANGNLVSLLLIGGFFFLPGTVLAILIALISNIVSGVKEQVPLREILKRFGGALSWILLTSLAFTGLVLSPDTFLLTLIIEIILALVYLWISKPTNKRILLGVLFANVFTQPIFVLSLADLGLNIQHSMNSILIVESVIWLIEAVIIYFVQKKELSFIHIFILTLILNVASFGLGLLLPI